MSEIPRSSPLSEWRLLIRGLECDLNDDRPAALKIWDRLNTSRRPGRIATALAASPLTDLDTISLDSHRLKTASPEESAGDAPAASVSLLTTVGTKHRLDRSLLHAARLVRRVHIDRAAIRIARTGTTQPEEDDELLLGPRRIKWLKQFTRDFEETEPALIQALHQGALHRAYHQPYLDLFDEAAEAFPGPPHDRHNHLLRFHFFRQTEGKDREAEQAYKDYTELDLPQNKRLSAPLRKALLSVCIFNDAVDLIEQDSHLPPFLRFRRADRDNDKRIEQLLKQSVTAYPTNRAVFETHIGWLKSKLENEDLKAAERKAWEAKLPVVMQCWTKALPDDFEPKLWLVEHFLDDEELDDARPFVEWLQVARQDDPRVKAMPWKFLLLEAMRLCRRKAWMADVPDKLLAAEAAWPVWLTKDWLPYLQAAWMLRSGDSAAYEQQRRAVCEQQNVVRDSLRDACMMLGAAQKMRVPAAELKPLRVPVEDAARKVKSLSTDDLVAVGGFFWDLQRTRLLYPSYRMHGSKFGRELVGRLTKNTRLIEERIQQPEFILSMLWASEHRFWCDGHDVKILTSLNRHAKHVPLIAAAKLNAVTELRWHMCRDDCEAERTLLSAAETTEQDPFYRHWFATLQNRADKQLEKLAQQGFGLNAMMGAMAGAFNVDRDDNSYLEDDEECDCEDCRARRAEAVDGFAAPEFGGNPLETFFSDAFLQAAAESVSPESASP